MLAPEVWAFDPPSRHLKIKKEALNEKGTIAQNLIETHNFNHLVSVVLPHTPQVPEQIEKALTLDCDYYKVNGLRTSELVEKEFIDAFIKKGHLTLLSTGTYIDLDDCLSVTRSGHLTLSLCRESYQKLGLDGKPVISKKKEPQRYVVTLDLTADHFVPGKKNYERVRSSLLHRLPCKFNVILAWEPPDTDVCPSSVAAYLSDHSYDVQLCKTSLEQRRMYDVSLPLLNTPNACDPEEFLEWLGAFTLNCDLDSQDEFLSTYKPPLEAVECAQVAILTWSGHFMPSQILNLFEELSEYSRNQELLPWLSLHVQGFSDSPVSWGLKPHSYFTDGDNSYTIIIQPDGRLLTAALQSNVKMIK